MSPPIYEASVLRTVIVFATEKKKNSGFPFSFCRTAVTQLMVNRVPSGHAFPESLMVTPQALVN